MTPFHSKLEKEQAALLVIDIQERLASAMDSLKLSQLVRRTRALIEGAKALSIPIVISEQYPKGLGTTIGEIQDCLPSTFLRFEKIKFSAVAPHVMDNLAGKRQIVLCGMETHVCVFQTARDLLANNMVPFLCADALLSRNEEDHRLGMGRAQQLGAVITTVEGALFDLLEKAGTPEFKIISQAIK